MWQTFNEALINGTLLSATAIIIPSINYEHLFSPTNLLLAINFDPLVYVIFNSEHSLLCLNPFYSSSIKRLTQTNPTGTQGLTYRNCRRIAFISCTPWARREIQEQFKRR